MSAPQGYTFLSHATKQYDIAEEAKKDEAWPDEHGDWSVRFTGTLVWSNDGCMERCILLGDRRGVLGAATVGGKA